MNAQEIVGFAITLVGAILVFGVWFPWFWRVVHEAVEPLPPCDCEVCQSPGETVALARGCIMSLHVAGKHADADTVRALLHLLEKKR